MKKLLITSASAVAALLIVVQFVPYGRDHTNPPVLGDPPWNSPLTRELAVRACFDCHSNQTAWPWYSNVAPISWLIQRDVGKGRREVNFSEWPRRQKEARESADTVRKGEMPPWVYALPGTAAALTPREKQMLAAGLAATLGDKTGKRRRD